MDNWCLWCDLHNMVSTLVLYLPNKQASDWICWLFTESRQISLHNIFYYESTAHSVKKNEEKNNKHNA